MKRNENAELIHGRGFGNGIRQQGNPRTVYCIKGTGCKSIEEVAAIGVEEVVEKAMTVFPHFDRRNTDGTIRSRDF